MIPQIRPIEERVASGIYSQAELSMIVGQMGQLQNMVDAILKIYLNTMTISEADRLFNGAPN